MIIRISHAVLCAFVSVWLLCGQALSLGGTSSGKPLSSQALLVSLGILSFQDDSGMNAPPELGPKIAHDLQQKLVVTYKDLLPRVINTGMDASAIRALTVEQLAELGKQNGVRFVVRGGLLAMTAERSGEEKKTTAQLYAEIISVETASINSVRAEGVSTQTGTTSAAAVQLSSMDFQSDEFRSSALGQALSSAIEQLVTSLYQSISSPLPEAAVTGGQSQNPTDVNQNINQADPIRTPDAAAAEMDEELQQLIAQAEALLSNSSASSTESLNSLSRSLEGLKAALGAKATLLEQAQDTAPADQDIAARKQELQTAVSTITQQVSSGDAAAIVEQQPSGEKKNVLASIGEYLGETLNILQKIQEIRATFRSASEDTSDVEPSSVVASSPDAGSEEAIPPAEEPVEEVSGVVTESGEPAEGVTVTEPESGASATTDGDGSYTLKGIPGGKLARLILTKASKQLAIGRIDLPRGRSAIADFELKPQSARASAPTLRIIPSTVLVRAVKTRSDQTGMLRGVVRDAQGRPVTRALVNLKGLAVARTDSQGQYAFMNVPAGVHQLTVQKSGLRLKSEQIRIAAKKSSESKTRFASNDRIPKERDKPPVIVRGTGTVLRGVVLDHEKRPVAGAKITVIQSANAVSVLSGPQGNYELRDLKPGTYRLLVSKTGYETGAQNIPLRAAATESRDFQLKKVRSAFLERVLARQQTSRGETRRQERASNTPPQPSGAKKDPTGGRPATETRNDQRIGMRIPGSRTQLPPVVTVVGAVRGQVTDAKSGKPIAGATVSITGRPSVLTNSQGDFVINGLAPGAYQVVIRRNGFADSGGTLVVRARETVARNFQLTPKIIPPIRLRVPR